MVQDLKTNSSSDNKVLLRALEPEDIDLLYQWENDKSIWHVSNTQVPFSRYILKKYIENSHQDIYQTQQLRLMIDVQNELNTRTIGAVDLFDFDAKNCRAGVGILIANSLDRNKGLAKIALSELIHYAFEILHLHQLYCNISTDNLASIKLFTRAGFEISGTKRHWIKTGTGFKDELFMQLIHHN